jgi:hypothetical protein
MAVSSLSLARAKAVSMRGISPAPKIRITASRAQGTMVTMSITVLAGG